MQRLVWGAALFFECTLSILFLSACKTTWQPLPGEMFKTPVDENGDGRVLLQEQLIRFEFDDGVPVVRERSRRVVRIEGSRSKDLADLVVRYSRSFTEVLDARARALYPDGTKKTWDLDAAKNIPLFSENTLYDDSRLIAIDIPDPAPGTIVEHFTERRTRSPELFPFGSDFAESTAVETARFVVEVPGGMGIDWAVLENGRSIDSPPAVEQRDGWTVYTWERRNLKPFTLPPAAPPWMEVVELVLVRLSSWTDAAGNTVSMPRDAKEESRFEHKLVRGALKRSSAIEAQVRRILTGVPDEPRAKARRLYAWVRDSVRYCAVEVGLGGWIPHDPTKVLEARAGDCKDKANLLKTMLDVAGIKSHLVTIYNAPWPRSFRLPVLAANFNHAILAIDLPEGRVFVDPTSRTAAFGDLPAGDEDRSALLLDEEGTGLLPTTSSSPEVDGRRERYAMRLLPNGEATGTFESELRGEDADDARRRLLLEPSARHDELAQDVIALRAPRVKDKGLTWTNAVPPEEPTPLEVRGELSFDVIRGWAGQEDALIRTSDFLPSPAWWFSEAERRFPIFMGHRSSDSVTLRMQLPDGVRAASLPSEATCDSPWARYARAVRLEDNGRVVVIERNVTRLERTVPPESYAAYQAWAADVFLADSAPIVLERSAP